MAPPDAARGRAGPLIRAGAALILTLAALAFGALAPAGAQAGEERIVAYQVDLRIEDDGTLAVHEVVTYDFGGSQRHGVIREIPTRLHYDDRFDRVYPIERVAVQASEGTPAGYKVERGDNVTAIRIGDPDLTITGVHRYTIDYRVRAALNHFDDHDELYWNAIGSRWAVPIGEATVRVEAPAAVGQAACFAGPDQSRLPCATSAVDGAVARFSHEGLRPFEAFTVVVGIPTGVVPLPEPRLEERWSIERAFSVTPGTVGASAGLLVVVLAGVARLVWKAGRDRRYAGSPVDVVFGSPGGEEQQVPVMERPVTPVEFAPPDDIRPGQVGTLIDERAQPLDVIATIVDLAVRGYLRIEEIPKQGWFGKPDWKLVRLKEPDGLLSYERLLLDGLFEDAPDDEVQVSALKNTFADRLQQVQDALYDDAVAKSWFPTRPDHVRTRWGVLGGVLAAIGALAVWGAAAKTRLGLVPIPVVIGGLLLLIGSRWMPSRTAKGTAALRRVLGFRRFIDESEAERARFAERKNLFSEYLPYAIVFGCTEKWARAFAGLDDQLPETNWYAGTHPFTVGGFSDSMDGFTVTTAGTIASTPSGSGSSGFGGGGFSGGGGGGGGGGSW